MISHIVLSPDAEDDIIEIYRSGIANFGIGQADAYEAMLRHSVKIELAFHPFIGIARPELGHDIRALYRGAHHIYYRVEGDTLTIIRIVSGRMNVEQDDLYSVLQKLRRIGPAQD